MRTLSQQKRIALVAHDGRKEALLLWAGKKRALLLHHLLFATGTTGRLLEEHLHIKVHKFQSGPLGGDIQIGASIVTKEVDTLIFFWDPLLSMPHDPDIKALLRLATVWNIPVACNETTADFLILSPLMEQTYDINLRGIKEYSDRQVPS